MSIKTKMINVYAKSFFEMVYSFQIKNNNDSSYDFKKFKIGKLVSTDKPVQQQITFSVFAMREELRAVSSLITLAPDCEEFFKNPTVSEKEKLKVIKIIFPGLTAITSSFLRLLAEKSDLALIPQITDTYEEILLRFKKTTKIKIISPSIFEEQYALFLLNALKSITKSKNVILSFCYDPKLLGGFILEYNSTSIDASILKELSLFFEAT